MSIDLEGMRAAAEKATPGPWHGGHFANDDHPCECRYILSECYMGSVAEISVNNDLPVSEGGNDAPPPEEAKANIRFIATANPAAVLALLEYVERLKGEIIALPRCPRCGSPDPARHPAVQSGGEVQLCQSEWHARSLIQETTNG